MAICFNPLDPLTPHYDVVYTFGQMLKAGLEDGYKFTFHSGKKEKLSDHESGISFFKISKCILNIDSLYMLLKDFYWYKTKCDSNLESNVESNTYVNKRFPKSSLSIVENNEFYHLVITTEK